jgi:hypothetical protein
MVTAPPYKFDDETWKEWIVQVSLGCDKLLESEDYSSEDRISFMQLYCRLIDSLPGLQIGDDDRLRSILSLDVRFMVWIQSSFQPGTISLVLEAQPLAVGRGPIREALLELLDLSRSKFELRSLWFTPLSVVVIREILIHGSLQAQEKLIVIIARAVSMVCGNLTFYPSDIIIGCFLRKSKKLEHFLF